MLTKYVQEAMRRAHYEVIKEDGSFLATIPGFKGVWANAASLEECREELQSVLEGWLILKLQDNDDDLPALGRLVIRPKRAEKRKNAPRIPPRACKAS